MFSIHRLIVGLVFATHAGVAAGQPGQRPQAAQALPGVSVTQKGPDTAPVTIVEFSDFECPFCATIPPVITQLLEQYPGQIRLVFKHSPLPIHKNAPLAHEAALAAGLQGKFWEMHDLLFARQKQLSMADLVGYAEALHLDVPAFTAALTDRRLKPIVDQDLIEARAFGVNATPTFFVNGQRYSGAATLATLKGFVDRALGKPAAATATAVSAGQRVSHINTDGAPRRGAEDAQVTIVEFSDLQCPFCRQATPVLDWVMTAYDGRVKWLFKHFPLSIHPNAMLAHQAALAAAEQGKFWVMHDALFADQKNVKRDALVAAAARFGLDVPRFTADLDSPRLKARIETERREGTALGVTGTPTFFINGRKVVGFKTHEEMKAIIEQELVGRPATSAEANESGAAAAGPELAKGEPNAPITMLWYSDLRSALTAKASDLVNQVMAAYPGQIRVVMKHRPLESRPESRLVHEAGVAAAAQEKFWEMHALILAEPAGPIGRDRLIDLARRAKLDEAPFVKDLDGGAYRANVERDLEEAQRRSVRGTPVFFVNGQRIDGIQPLSYFKRIIDQELRRRTDK
jgi:protein-disulfide isomerase